MSTETLKYFEDKSTEAIINWMLSHLKEEQIRMCLDQSGIPDTSVIAAASGGGKSPMPVAAASAAAGPVGPTVLLADGTRKQLPPGAAGSSTDPMPPPPSPATPPTGKSSGAGSTFKKFLDTYRKRCENTPYLIKSVTRDGVEYYEFKEIEDSDLIMNPTLAGRDAGWVYSNVPISQFKGKCSDEVREVFDIMKEEYPEEFLNASREVLDIAFDYVSSGLVSPIPQPALAEIAEEAAAVEISEPTPVGAPVEITESMLKAVKIQQASTAWIQQNYPDLHARGLGMYPIFVYGTDGAYVNHLTAVVVDGKLTLVHERTNQALFNKNFKKKIKQIDDSIKAGLYTPSDNMPAELSAALEPGPVAEKIKYIYNKDRLASLTLFGGLEDEEPWLQPGSVQESFEEVPQLPLFTETGPDVCGLMSDLALDESPVAAAAPKSSSKDLPLPPGVKKVSEMSIPEIEERMRQIGGDKYVLDYEPRIGTRKGPAGEEIKTVQYVKRTNKPELAEDFEQVPFQPFAEFQGRPSINDGPGKFGDEDDVASELLFG